MWSFILLMWYQSHLLTWISLTTQRSYLIINSNLFNALSNLICYYFVENFYLFASEILNYDWFSYTVLIWLQYQYNVDLIKMNLKSLPFSPTFGRLGMREVSLLSCPQTTTHVCGMPTSQTKEIYNVI